jgi:hypothetical protein
VQINALEEAFGADELDHPEAGLREEREEKENIRDMSDLGDVPDADRARLDEPEPAPVVAGSIIDLPFPAWMAEQQRADAYLGKIVSYLKPDGDSAMAEEWRKKHPKTEFRLVGSSGVLVTKVKLRATKKSFTEHWAVMVPRTAVTAVLELYHGSSSIHNHNGRNKTLGVIRKRFTWPGLHADVAKWIKSCKKCLARKRVVLSRARYALSTSQEAPMNRIAIDFVGPLTTTKKNNSYILTVFCPFSRWAQAFPVSRNTALKTIECLKKHIATFSTPSEVLSDRGFVSAELKEFLESMGIKHVMTAAYTPSTNGAVEGFHRYLAQQLSMRVNDKHSNWDEKLDEVLFAYRTAPIDGTMVSPFNAVFAREPNLPIDNVLREATDQEFEHESKRRRKMTPAEYCGIAQSAAQGIHEEVRERQSERFARNQRQDDKEAPICIYEPGQKIFLKYPKGTFRKPGGTTKFSQVNNGPYTIKRRIETSSGATVYEVEHDTTKYRCKVGHRRIIPYDEWDLPVGASRPRLLPGEMAEHKRTKQSLNQADEAEPMEIDSGDDQAELPGEDKAIADHELDQVLGDFQAREAIIGTDSDNSDCEHNPSGCCISTRSKGHW